MSEKINLKNVDDEGFALAEYSALREEILKRIELQNKILNLSLIIAGTAVSAGFQLSNGPILLLIYPPIALALSAGWEQNNLRIRQIGIYIRERIERRSSCGGWEKYRIDAGVKPTGTARFARFAFIITQIVTIGLSWLQLSSWTSLPWTALFLTAFDVMAVVATGLIIRRIPLEEIAAPSRDALERVMIPNVRQHAVPTVGRPDETTIKPDDVTVTGAKAASHDGKNEA